VRSRARLGLALRFGRLNRPKITTLLEEVVAAEAGVPLAAVGVEDPEGRPPARRAGPVAGHDHLRPLTHDVASEADPRRPGELEADPGCLADGAGDARGQARWLEDREADPGPAGEGRQPAEPIDGLRFPIDLLGQVHDEEVDRPAREQGTRDGDPLLDVRRGHDDEPLRLDAAGNRLDRVERRREVQPGDDRAGGLGPRGKPQREGRPAARQVAAERDAHAPRQAARTEDRVECREARREDPSRIGLARSTGPGLVIGLVERNGREGADDLADSRGSGRAPPRPKGREGRRHVRGERRHEPDYRTSVRMNQGPADGPVVGAGGDPNRPSHTTPSSTGSEAQSYVDGQPGSREWTRKTTGSTWPTGIVGKAWFDVGW
jgi:hypothetical protein